MHNIVNNLILINKEISAINSNTKVIAVSKTFPIDKITPLIKHGHVHFGENKVQEAVQKWSEVKKTNNNIKLHLIGKLQTNKVKFVLPLFDYIHSLDNAKLASKIFQYEKELNKKIKLFIQVNIADETQKSGINVNDLNNFYHYCVKELSLNVIGLMCLPPIQKDSEEYFKKMKEIANQLNLKDLSMGMSSDYSKAVENGSTFLRLGTMIMGARKPIK